MRLFLWYMYSAWMILKSCYRYVGSYYGSFETLFKSVIKYCYDPLIDDYPPVLLHIMPFVVSLNELIQMEIWNAVWGKETSFAEVNMSKIRKLFWTVLRVIYLSRLKNKESSF